MRYSAFRVYNLTGLEERNGVFLTVLYPKMVRLGAIEAPDAATALTLLHDADPAFPHYLHAVGEF